MNKLLVEVYPESKDAAIVEEAVHIPTSTESSCLYISNIMYEDYLRKNKDKILQLAKEFKAAKDKRKKVREK